MEQAQNQPIHWDKHRIPVNITFIFSIAVVVYGFVGVEWLLVIAGLGVGAYSWFTNPRQYAVYSDALSVVYGRPRIKVIPFHTISRLEMRELQTPDRLRVWLTNGRRVVLMVKDVDTFHDRLEQALNEFERTHPEYSIAEEPSTELQEPPPQPENPSENRPPDFT